MSVFEGASICLVLFFLSVGARIEVNLVEMVTLERMAFGSI
jgi:hypothetical protein